jgi:glycosyltransferase involved in cell wall biosynthesis
MPSLLSINNYYYLRGGAEAVFLRHNTMFANMGWQVAPFAMHHPNNIDSPWAQYFVDEIEFGSEYSLVGKLRRVPKVIYSIEAQRKIRALLDVFSADICHAHNIYHHISPSILKTVKQRGIPIVITLHDLKLACPAYNMLARDGICERCKDGKVHNVLVHRCIKESVALSAVILVETMFHRMLDTFDRYVDKFIVPSRFYVDKLVEWGWKREKFSYIPNAIDTEQFIPDFNAGKPLVYFGRLSREKGLATLISAAALAGVPLRIVGTGPEEHSLRFLSEKTKADIKFLGYLKGSALHDVIRSSRAVVLPSEWYENAPLSIMEANALGKPVIGAAIGGIPELICENETGITYKSGSVDMLATAISQFYQLSDNAVAAMGRAGRLWMETEFNLNKYKHKMVSLYQEFGVRALNPFL